MAIQLYDLIFMKEMSLQIGHATTGHTLFNDLHGYTVEQNTTERLANSYKLNACGKLFLTIIYLFVDFSCIGCSQLHWLFSAALVVLSCIGCSQLCELSLDSKCEQTGP